MRDDVAREDLALQASQSQQADRDTQTAHIISGAESVAKTLPAHPGDLGLVEKTAVLNSFKVAQSGTALPPPAGNGPVTEIKPDVAGVVILPADAKISQIQASGADLRIVLDDGRVFVVAGGVANPPSIKIGAEVLPGASLTAVFGPFQEVQPASGNDLPPAGSLGFTTASTTIDQAFQFSGLLDAGAVNIAGRETAGNTGGGGGGSSSTASAAAGTPTADNLAVSGDEDSMLTAALNGADSDGTIAGYIIKTLPASGTLWVNSDGTGSIVQGQIVYAPVYFQPNADWNGDTSFEYTAVDDTGNESANATVSLNVGSVNDASTAENVSASGDEDTILTIIFDGADSDGTVAGYIVKSLPANGTLWLNNDGTGAVALGQQVSGTIYFQPDADWNGNTSFDYAAIDNEGAESANATISLDVAPVNEVPTAENRSAGGDEDTILTVNFDGADSDGTVVGFIVKTLPANGTLWLNNDGTGAVAQGQQVSSTIYFQPNADWNGNSSFEYAVIDNEGAESANATVTLDVNSVNDIPTAENVPVSGNEDTTLTITFDGADIDGTVAGYIVKSLPTNGTLWLNANGTGAIAQDQQVSGTIYFRPAANWNGNSSFDYAAIDNEGAESAQATISLNVAPVNDQPLVFSGVPVPSISEIADNAPGENVTVHTRTGTITFSDVDIGDTHIAYAVPLNPVHNSVINFTPEQVAALQAGFSIGAVDQNTKSVGWTYTISDAVIDFLGAAGAEVSLRVFIEDNNGAFTFRDVDIAIFGRNDAPVITSGDSFDVAENTTAVGAVTSTDVDIVATKIYSISGGADASKFNIDSSTGALTFKTAPNFENPTDANGDNAYQVRVTVWDAFDVDTQDITVRVTNVNETPAAQNSAFDVSEDGTLAGSVLATDPDSNPLTYSLVDPVDGLVFNSDGTFTFTPGAAFQYLNEGESAQVTFQYHATDGALTSNSATVTITVEGANENGAPTAENVSVSGNEDALLTITLDGDDADGDLDGFIVKSLPANGTLWLNANGTGAVAIGLQVSGTLYFQPNADWNGNTAFTYTAIDVNDVESAVATVSIEVDPVNDAPVITSASSFTVAENTATVGAVTSTDIDGGPRTYSISGGSDAARFFMIDANMGTFGFVSPPNFENPSDAGANNVYNVEVQANDGQGGITTQAITVTVTNVNEAPNAGNMSATLLQGAPYSSAFSVSDPENDPLTAEILTALPNGVTVSGLNFSYTPQPEDYALDSGETRSFSFDYRVSDGVQNSGTRTVTFTVGGLNDAPVAQDASFSVSEDGVLAGAVVATDVDIEALTYSLVNPVDGLVFNADGTFSFTPGAAFQNLDDGETAQVTFQYRANDGTANSNIATATITINGASDNVAPVAENVSASGNEDALITVTLDGEDADGNLEGFIIKSLPANGTLYRDSGETQALAIGDQVDAGENVYFRPAANFSGEVAFNYTAIDAQGEESVPATATIDVSPVADAPVMNVSVLDDVVLAQPLVRIDNGATDDVTISTMTALANGGFVATWQIDRAAVGIEGFDVFARIYDAGGTAVSGDIAVNLPNTDTEGQFQTVALSHGGFAVVWRVSEEILTRVFDASGDELSSGVIAVNAPNAVDDSAPQVTALANGFVVTWQTLRNDGSNDYDVYARVFDNTGNATGAEFPVNTPNGVFDIIPSILALSGGGFAVSWINDMSFGDRFVRVYDADGSELSGQISVRESPTGNVSNGNIVALEGGGFVVTWNENYNTDSSTDQNVFARVFDASGTEIPAGLITVSADNAQSDTFARVVALSGGGFAVTWQSFRNTDGSFDDDVIARVYNANGVEVSGGEILVSAPNTRHDSEPQIAALAGGGFVVAWSATRVHGGSTDTDIIMRIYDASGTEVSSGEMIVNAANNLPDRVPQIFALPGGGFVVTWYQASLGREHFMSQQFDESGNATGAPLNWGNSQFNPTSQGSFILVHSVAMDGSGAMGVTVDVRDDFNGFRYGTLIGFGASGTAAGLEDAPLSLPEIAVALADTDGSETLVIALSGFPAGATFSAGALDVGSGKWLITDPQDIADLASVQLVMNPPANYNGSFDLTVEAIVTDSASINGATQTDTHVETRTIPVLVQPVNDLPVANAVSASGNEDTTLTVNLSGSDVEGAVNFVIKSLPTNGTLWLNANGTGAIANNQQVTGPVYFKPNADWNGNTSFNYSAIDGSGAQSGNVTASIQVDAVPDAPTVSAISRSTNEDTIRSILLNASDAEDGTFTFVIKSLPANGTLHLLSNGSDAPLAVGAIPGDLLYFKPAPNWNGQISFDYAAIDPTNLESEPGTITITVNPVNDIPVANAVSVSGNEDTTLTVNLSGSDVEGAVNFVIKTLPANGTLWLNADGTGAIAVNQQVTGPVYFKPNAEWSGSVSFTYTAIDGNNVQSPAATATIDVSPVADAPSFQLVGNTGDKLYFMASTSDSGAELWSFDGTTSQRVTDINPGPGDSYAGLNGGFVSLNGKLYFNATGTGGSELWSYDGTTAELIDVNSSGSSFAGEEGGLIAFNGNLYFSAYTGDKGFELWKYDGTNAELVADINQVNGSSYAGARGFIEFNGKLYFSATNGTSGYELWSYDGTTAELAANISPDPGGSDAGYYGLVEYDGKLYFSAYDAASGYELWSFDGSTAQLAANIRPSSDWSSAGRLGEFIVFNGKLYFSANDGTSGFELWSYDGTAAALAANINSSSASSEAGRYGGFTEFNGKIYFSATNGTNGYELWSFDGTDAELVADIVPNSGSSNAAQYSGLTVFNGKLYFNAQTTANGSELWSYDGVNAPQLASDIVSGLGSSFAGLGNGQSKKTFFVFGEGDLVAAGDEGEAVTLPAINASLADTDGSETLTIALSGYPAGATFSVGAFDVGSGKWLITDPLQIAALGIAPLVMNPPASWNGTFTLTVEAIVTDTATLSSGVATDTHTETATIEVTINPGNEAPAAEDVSASGNEDALITVTLDGDDADGDLEGFIIQSLPANGTLYRDSGETQALAIGDQVDAGDNIYFRPAANFSGEVEFTYTAIDAQGAESAQATATIDVSPVADAPSLQIVGVGAGKLFFNARDAANGGELWSFDGTTAQRVTNIHDGANSSNAAQSAIYEYNGKLYFSANDGINGSELWSYDGSTVKLEADIHPSLGSSAGEFGFIEYDGKLFFSANGGTGSELWSYDGTTATLEAEINSGNGNSSPGHRGFAVYNGKLYFGASNGSGNGAELWSFDGTDATMITATLSDTTGLQPGRFKEYNGKLYFSAYTAAAGYELWSFDGTAVQLVQNINANAASSSAGEVSGFTEYNGKLYFSAQTAANGFEIWSFDGATAVMAAEIRSGPNSSSAGDTGGFTEFNGKLYFCATSGSTNANFELWSFDGTNAVQVGEINSSALFGSFAGRAGFAVYDGKLYFSAAADGMNFELWSYDGINAPQLAADINNAPTSSNAGQGPMVVFGAGGPVGGYEDTEITLPAINASLTDTDGSETLTIALSGYPTGAMFSVGAFDVGSGKWLITNAAEIADLDTTPLTMTPPANWNGTFTMTVEAIITDSATLSTGAASDTHTETATFDVTIDPLANTLVGGPGADTFLFTSLAVTDVIQDYSGTDGDGDLIDLSSLFQSDNPVGEGIVSHVGNELRVDLDGAGPGGYEVAATFAANPAANTISILYTDTSNQQQTMVI